MKKEKTVFYKFRMPKIYREQLEEIEKSLTQETLKDFKPSIKITIHQTKDYFDTDTTTKVSDIPNDISVYSLRIVAFYEVEGSYGSYSSISVEFGKRNCEISLSSTNPTLKGIVEEVKGIVSTQERPFRSNLSRHPALNIWIPYLLILGPQFLYAKYFSHVHPHKSLPATASIIFIVTTSLFLVWVLVIAYLGFPSHSSINPNYEKSSLGFWRRNKENIWTQIIAGIPGAIVGSLVTFLILKL